MKNTWILTQTDIILNVFLNISLTLYINSCVLNVSSKKTFWIFNFVKIASFQFRNHSSHTDARENLVDFTSHMIMWIWNEKKNLKKLPKNSKITIYNALGRYSTEMYLFLMISDVLIIFNVYKTKLFYHSTKENLYPFIV